MEMTSKERILAAMNLQRPDRVPLMCQFSIGCMMEQLHPDPVAFWYDQQTFADGLIELRERFRFDGILVSLHGHSDDWKRDLLSREELGEGSVRLEYPDRTELHCWQDLPVVTFRSPRKSLDLESVDVERDIPGQLDYIPVSHNLYFRLDPENLYGIFDYLYSRVGDSCSIHGEITSPLDYYLDLFGYEQGLMGLIMYPAKAAQILQRFTDGVKRIARGMCRMPVDAIKISSPFAGRGFISSEFYEQFVLPYESQIIREIRQAGKFVYIHTCGSIGRPARTHAAERGLRPGVPRSGAGRGCRSGGRLPADRPGDVHQGQHRLDQHAADGRRCEGRGGCAADHPHRHDPGTGLYPEHRLLDCAAGAPAPHRDAARTGHALRTIRR